MHKSPNTGAGTRMPSLTGIRFPALFMVFLAHLSIAVPFADPDVDERYAHYLGGIGKVGLSFFFVLSGFILAWSPRAGASPLLFWRRRLAKLVPLHWVTYAVAMVVFAHEAVTGKAAVMNFLMVHAWSPDPDVFGSVNAPSWSLTCLVFFYLLFPALYRGAARIEPQYLWWCAAAVVALIVAVPAVVRAQVPADIAMAPQSPASSVRAFWLVDLFPVTRLLDFVLGILMARIVRTGRWIGVGPLPLTGLLVAAYVASMEAPREYRLVAVMIVPLALFISSLAAADSRGRKTVLATRPVQWLGDLSYAFILIHWPVMMFFFDAFGRERLYSVPFAFGVIALDLVVSVVLAWLLTIGVEKPFVRLLAKPRKAATVPATATATVLEDRPVPAPADAGSR
ncbi:acyltransferase family protein [Streptomyces syringium]|uniref:acyltransferase family protein n=2 Tax=Streptomyces syringium TaxID=76729 RepID=UPI003401534E